MITTCTTLDQVQECLHRWACEAFGADEVSKLEQRGLRTLEEAVELFQVCTGGSERARAMAHKLVDFVFARPVGELGNEVGGVCVTLLVMCQAAGISFEQELAREAQRVLDKDPAYFAARNARKNAAGFKLAE